MMKKTTTILIGIFAVIALIAGWFISSYNGIVSLEEAVDTQYSNVEIQLQRRFDLIPNLVNATKGYMTHETEVFTSIAEARSKLAGATTIDDKVEASSELEGALSRLLVVVENYPELKASEQFIALQDELAGTENRITKARQDYNEEASTYNKKIKTFPNSIIAGMGGFESVDYYEADEGAKEVPTVSFE